jgi:hypothetical protein
MSLFKLGSVSYVIIFLFGISLSSYGQSQKLPGWETNTDKAIIELEELKRGGPPKDGIPAIDNPQFVSTDEARSWIAGKEPVIVVQYEDVVRAYPLQVMIWHEIVNDRINGDPLLVTFCPLCYSALVFERTVDGEELEFGVSGFLRHSDLVMFDRKTETLWQQFTGKAIVGDYVGTTLEQIPSQIISFNQFKENYPAGTVLSKSTGYDRNYGRNPYTGYDDINNTPLFGAGNDDGRLPPMEKVIGVKLNNHHKAYPSSVSRKKQVINDEIANTLVLVVHTDGATSALDEAQIAESKESGSTGVFKRTLNKKELTFAIEDGNIVDEQTGSVWTVTGKAVEGEHKGQQLEAVTFGDYFAFAWLVFWPETEIYNRN